MFDVSFYSLEEMKCMAKDILPVFNKGQLEEAIRSIT